MNDGVRTPAGMGEQVAKTIKMNFLSNYENQCDILTICNKLKD